MRHSKFFLILLLFIIPFFTNGNVDSDSTNISYMEVYNQLINLKSDPSKTSVVSGLVIKRDAATFDLKDGTLTLCTPVNGRVCAAIFIGNGSFKYTPPSEVEKEQLYRFYEKTEFDKPITHLFLMFADSTLSELEGRLRFEVKERIAALDQQVSNSLKFLSEEGDEYFDTDFMKSFLEDEINGSFFAHFNDNMFFRINPFQDEEETLEHPAKSFLHEYREVVNQFPASDKLKKEYPNFSVKDRFIVSDYNINSTIESGLDYSASSGINFVPAIDNQKWIHLLLDEELKVDSVFINGNKKCGFFRGDDNSVLWIHPEEPFLKNSPYSLKIFYHGDLLEQDDLGWISLKSPDYWYPRTEYRQRVRYNMTFNYPSKYKFAACGEKVSEQDSEDVTRSVWLVKEPARNASFNIGLFKEFDEKEDSIPEVTVYINRTGITELRNALAPQGILLKDNMEEQIGGEVANCCRLYKNLFGDISLNHIYATPIPYLHGEAFPGLVHLSWITYHGLDDDVEGMIFRAHEIAHQWWGIGVGFKTYHDQWISEAFSEYSGLWFVQTLLKDNEEFFRILDKWKDQILSNRKYIIGSGQEAGPVSLGYRTQSSETKGDYYLIIYKKGAWVLHMLRNMLLDIKTMNEDKFKSLMREFYNTYRNKQASTNDFKKMCDKYFNEDMTWFFNQWIYGTQIPEYSFAYKTVETPDGKYNVECRIKQANVPADFKAYTILLIKFDDDRFARIKIKIHGPVTEFTIPGLPLKPDEVIFNDLHSTLCEVDYEDWN